MSIVKQAKDALDRGDTDACVSLCSQGLLADPKNYNLLLLQAAAHKHTRNWPECEQALLLAVNVQPRSAPAWQGLLQVADEMLADKKTYADRKVREKWMAKREECLRVLVDVAVEGKRGEFVERLVSLLIDDDRHLEAAQFVKTFDEDRFKEILQRWEEKSVKEQVERAKFRLGADPIPVLTAKTKAMVYLESPLTECLEGEPLFERLLYICTNMVSEKSASRLKAMLSDIETPTAALLKSDLSDCPNTDQPGAEGTINFMLSRANAQRTMSSIKEAREKIQSVESHFFVELSNSHRYLARLEGLVCCSEQRFEDGINLLKDRVDNNDDEVRQTLLTAYEATEQYEEALLLCDDTVKKCHILCRLGRYEQAKSVLFDDSSVSLNHEGLLLLGICNWHLDDKQAAYDNFIAAAKANPSYHLAFTWLGRYYSDVEGEQDRAERCYRKALSLCSGDHEAAIGLSQYLSQKHLHLDVVQLLEPLVLDHPHNYEAWRLLGVAYFYLKSFTKASRALHLCLKGARHGRDKRILLLLGHSYRSEGRLKAAGRAFQTVIDISSDDDDDNVRENDNQCVTAKIALAKIKTRLCEFEEAVCIWESLLEITSERIKIGCRKEYVYCLTRAIRHSIDVLYSRQSAHLYNDKLNKVHIDDPYLMAEKLIAQSLCDESTKIDRDMVIQLLTESLQVFKASRQRRAKVLSLMAVQYHHKGDHNSAMEAVSSASRLYPHPHIDTLLARLTDSTVTAERHYHRAIANTITSAGCCGADKQHLPAIMANLGFLYAQTGRLDEAVKAFTQCRLTDPDRAGEAMYGLQVYGGQAVSLELMADCARSLFVHHFAAQSLLRDDTTSNSDTNDISDTTSNIGSDNNDKVVLSLKPIIDRLSGVSSDHVRLRELITKHLHSYHDHVDPTRPMTMAMKRSVAIKQHTLFDYLQGNPFDLHAIDCLLTDGTIDDNVKVSFLRSRLRLLQERYDRVEGTMRRHFDEVRQFELLREWLDVHGDVYV